MELTDETFRELARSSPWRWRSVHLLRESGGPPPDGEVEAWIRRPDRMRVAYDGGVHIVRQATDEVDAERGTDPMWQSYQWVAMLAPVELADGQDAAGTVLADLRETQRRGRRTWWANAVPTEAYYPRCGCCALLWSQISDRGEYGGGNPTCRRLTIRRPTRSPSTWRPASVSRSMPRAARHSHRTTR